MFTSFILIVTLTLFNVSPVPTHQKNQLIQNIRELSRQFATHRLNKYRNIGSVAMMHEMIRTAWKFEIKMSFIYLQHNISDVLKRKSPSMPETLKNLASTYKTVVSWCNPDYRLPTNISGKGSVCNNVEGCLAVLYNYRNNQPCGFLHFHNFHLHKLEYSFIITVQFFFFIKLRMRKIQLCTTEYGNSLTLLSVLTNKVIKRMHGHHPAFDLYIDHNEVMVNLVLLIYRCKTVIDMQFSAVDIPVSLSRSAVLSLFM